MNDLIEQTCNLQELEVLLAEQLRDQIIDEMGLNASEFEDSEAGIERVWMHPNTLDGMGCESPEDALIALIDLNDTNYDIGG